MIDQSRITSGFDLELLLSERYIKYFLLASFETGSMPWYMQDIDPDTGDITHIMIHPPVELQENRLYEPRIDFVAHPFLDQVPVVFTNLATACEVELLPDDQEADVRVTLIISIIAPPFLPGGDPVILTEQDMTMDAKFFLLADAAPNGGQRNVRFKLEVVDIDGPFLDKEKTLKRVKEEVDREIPLAIVGDGGAVQQISSQKFLAADDNDPPTCLALYVNLNLKNGPEPDAFFGARGDLTAAQNFLPRNHDLAFGFSNHLYPKLGSDIFQRMARPKEGGGFFYPLDPNDPGKGHINSVSVLPQGHPERDHTGRSVTVFDNILNIEVRGEYSTDLFDPDFTMTISLIPSIDDQGVLTFATDFDLNIPLFGWLLVGTALLSFLSLNLAIPASLAVLAAKALVEKLGEDEAVPIIEGKLEDASFADAFPNKLLIEERRWDPGYFTDHQVVSLVKEVPINDQGLAFAAFDLRVGKEPKLLEDSIIRSEVREANGDASGLLYRIRDWNDEFEKNLHLVFPATDRMEFVAIVPPDGDVEANRLHLTVEQAIARMESQRLLEKISYRPYKVDEEAHQIYQILALSDIEVPEIKELAKGLLRSELEQAHGQEFRQQAHDELVAELGREPTAEEIEARHDQILNDAVDKGAEKRYRKERERFLKFDLEPFEFADLQSKKLLVLEFEGLQIIHMRKSAGGAVYYRDRPDPDKGDNLLKLPHYKSEPILRA
jgi:hypothetical protein